MRTELIYCSISLPICKDPLMIVHPYRDLQSQDNVKKWPGLHVAGYRPREAVIVGGMDVFSE